MAAFQVSTSQGKFTIKPPASIPATLRREIQEFIRKAADKDTESIDHLLKEIEEEIPDVNTPRSALRAYMTARGWGQKTLERKSGVPQSNISKYLSGDLGIGKKVAKKFAKAFNVNYRKFL